MEKFDAWIAHKYIDWRGDKIGREGTVSAFARWVGVTQSTMSYWMSGNNTPDSAASINALVARFGGEVYDVLGIIPPSNDVITLTTLQEVANILKDIPLERQFDAVFALRAWSRQQGYNASDDHEQAKE